MAALAATSSVPAAADVYIIGSNVNGVEWVTADPGGLMTETSAGVFEWDGDVLGSEFKFNDGTWSGDPFPGTDIPSNIGAADYSEKVVLGEPYTVSAGGNSNNLSFANGLLEIRKPHVVLDLNTLTLTVTGDANTEVTVQYHLVGDFNEWDMNATMGIFAPQEDGTYLLKGVTLVTDKSADSLPELVVAADGYVRKYGSPTTAMYPFLLEEQTVYPLEENGLNIPYDCHGVYDVIFTPGDNPTLFLQRVSDVVIEKGTSENPWTVTELLAKDPDTEAITTGTWTTGYIVGWVNGAAYETGVQFEFAEGVEVSATNILIAASNDERDYTKCMPVQLPKGEVRDALNLSANPDNLGCRVDLFGNFEKYFRVAGIKAVSDYAFYDEPVIPDPEIDYSEIVLAMTDPITDETIKISFSKAYALDGGPMEFIVKDVACEGVHGFILTDMELDDKFLSFGSEESGTYTIINEDNLFGELHYTNNELSQNAENQPGYIGLIDLVGYYDIRVRFEGKTAYLEFMKNEEMTDRLESLAAYEGDVYLVGEFNDMKLADENCKMTRVSTGYYVWEGVISGQFKFNNGTWDEGFIPGTDIPFTIAASGTEGLVLDSWYPLYFGEIGNYWFHSSDLETERHVIIHLDLLNSRLGVTEVEDPEPDPEYVYVWVGMVDGGSEFAFRVKNHEEASIMYTVDPEYWGVDGVYVNGEWMTLGMDPTQGGFSMQIDGETTFLFHAEYKGELAFVDSTTGVVELENAAKIYVADGKVNIENLNVGDEIAVYNTGGQIISRYVAQSTSLSISLDRGQVYVVRAGTAAAKVML